MTTNIVKHPTHKNSSGFTLIELLIVIAIIGIPQYIQYKIRAYDAHSKQALKAMHLLCNAYWLDTDSTQGCDLPKIKDATYGFNQNTDVVATLPTSHWTNFSYLLNITVTPIPTVVIIFLRHSYNFF